ncbi:unnamed protein product [Pylaiella littoralis]
MALGSRWAGVLRRCQWVKVLALGSLLVLGGAFAERTMSAGSRRRSLEKIRTATSAADGGGSVVKVDDAKFDQYIAGVPRQYEAFVFFTATGSSFKCSACGPQFEEFKTMAESYQVAKAKTPEILNEIDIYFFVADYGQNRGSFQKLGLQSVPKILHFPPSLGEGEGGRYAVDQSRHLQSVGEVKAEAMARFVKDKTGIAIPIVRPEPPVAAILCTLLVLAMLMIKPIISNLGRLLRTIRNKYLWLTITLLVYTFGISGGVYDIIRNPAPFVLNKDESIRWFHPQSNAQFVVEGFITGGLTLLCGLSGILLVHVAPKIKHKQVQQVAVMVFGVGFLMLFYNVMRLYKSKNPWYRPVF